MKKKDAKNRYYVVRVPDVEGMSPSAMEQYIAEAVRNWGGQFEAAPEHPLGPPCILMGDGNVVALHIGRMTDKAGYVIAKRADARITRMLRATRDD